MQEQGKITPRFFEEDFIEYLRSEKIVSIEELSMIRKQMDSGQDLESILKIFLPVEILLEYKSVLLGIKRMNLSEQQVSSAATLLIPEELARKYTLIPFAVKEGLLQVAMADPTNRRALDDVSLYSGYPVEPFLTGTEEIKVAIREYFTIRKSIEENADKITGMALSWQVEEGLEYGQEAPVIRLVDSLLRQAVREKASDIHWEPYEKIFNVKFRIDGLLEVKTVLPIRMARSIAARLKVMAGMDVTERRIPQDGRIMLNLGEKKIDIRVSTFATVYGEKVVTRILDEDTALRSLAELGMRKDVEEKVRKLLGQPHGLILVSGPTGSGKTTTLYALLRELQSVTLNIVSIEDPVEYRLPGVNQAQVNTKIGVDFAGGLRAILRQDPDIIMVGEIRDKETAQIAVAAALTGHLVLSTVHTNTAAEALARMLDMNIEPYLVSAAVCGVIAQRLIRKLCPFCREVRPISPAEKELFGWDNIEFVYKAKGCRKCRGTGYLGRMGIHEYLPYNQEIKELVLQKSSSLLLEKASRALGIINLREDALQKVAEGHTSLEEAMRLSAGV